MAVILDVVCRLGWDVLKMKDLPIVLMLAAFVATFVFRINVIYIILFAIAVASWKYGKRKEKLV